MWIAEFTSRHYEFMACGDTRAAALGALIAGWQKWRRYADGVTISDSEVLDDCHVYHVVVGAFYLDGQVLYDGA